MATQTYEQLIAGANKIKENELPESNTHDIVGEQLLQMTNKMQEESSNTTKAFTDLETDRVKKTTELNISHLYPTLGVDGSNRYILAGAIAQVEEKYRTIQGLKISFVNENEETETWEYKGGTWGVAAFEEIGSRKLNKINLTVNDNSLRTESIIPDDDGFYLTDRQGNIIMKIDSNGFDVGLLSEHFKELLGNSGGNVDGIISDLQESKLYITDSQGYVIMYVDSEGIHSVNTAANSQSVFSGKKMNALGDSLAAGGVWQSVMVEKLGIIYDNTENSTAENAINWPLAQGGRGFGDWTAVKSAFLVSELNPDIIIIEANNSGLMIDAEGNDYTDEPPYHITQFIEREETDLQEALAAIPEENRLAGTCLKYAGYSQGVYWKEGADLLEWFNESNWQKIASTPKQGALNKCSVLKGAVEVIRRKNPNARIYWLIPSLHRPSYSQMPLLYDDPDNINIEKLIDCFSGNMGKYGGSETGIDYYNSFKMYKNICREYHIGILDMGEHSNIDWYNNYNFYSESNPNIHPLDSGYIRWGETICNIMK